jgi:single-stranded DNA-binding protein
MNEIKIYGISKIVSDVVLTSLPKGQHVMNFTIESKTSLGEEMNVNCSLYGSRAECYSKRYQKGDIVFIQGLLNNPKVFTGDNGEPIAVNSVSILSIFKAEKAEEDNQKC